MFKITLYFLGIILTSLGIFFTILYLNLLIMGYSFLEYVKFISREPIFWLLLLGIICLFISLSSWIFPSKKERVSKVIK